MSRIDDKFKELRKKKRAGLVLYITAGDPDLKTTEKLIPALEHAGADIIELGIPFTDPTADGPTIQAASMRALKNYFTLDDVFSMVERVREVSQVPILLFSYYNPIFKYGEEKAASLAQESGVDGMLVVDLPPEESKGLRKVCRSYGMNFIALAAPTSDDKRLKLIADSSSGFIYYVSVTGITGARKDLPKDIKEHIEKIKKFSKLPVAVGFGVSTPEQAKSLAGIADAVVVGSALVSIIGKFCKSKDLIPQAQKFVESLKKAITSGR
jgi:tryptophan synthase alpha chain